MMGEFIKYSVCDLDYYSAGGDTTPMIKPYLYHFVLVIILNRKIEIEIHTLEITPLCFPTPLTCRSMTPENYRYINYEKAVDTFLEITMSSISS